MILVPPWSMFFAVVEGGHSALEVAARGAMELPPRLHARVVLAAVGLHKWQRVLGRLLLVRTGVETNPGPWRFDSDLHHMRRRSTTKGSAGEEPPEVEKPGPQTSNRKFDRVWLRQKESGAAFKVKKILGNIPFRRKGQGFLGEETESGSASDREAVWSTLLM